MRTRKILRAIRTLAFCESSCCRLDNLCWHLCFEATPKHVLEKASLFFRDYCSSCVSHCVHGTPQCTVKNVMLTCTWSVRACSPGAGACCNLSLQQWACSCRYIEAFDAFKWWPFLARFLSNWESNCWDPVEWVGALLVRVLMNSDVS